jgi:hypothetical protein
MSWVGYIICFNIGSTLEYESEGELERYESVESEEESEVSLMEDEEIGGNQLNFNII